MTSTLTTADTACGWGDDVGEADGGVSLGSGLGVGGISVGICVRVAVAATGGGEVIGVFRTQPDARRRKKAKTNHNSGQQIFFISQLLLEGSN
jgi:hypothetical protein